MDKEVVLSAINFVEHPAINATLKDLGIISEVKIVDDIIIVNFALPFPNIPIKKDLIGSVQIIAESFGYKFEATERIMNEDEKQHFLEVEHANWKDGQQAMC